MGITLGQKTVPFHMPCDGELAEPFLSALIFPAYKLQVVIGAIGAGPQDGDCVCVDACHETALHMNVGCGARGAMLRSHDCIYIEGGSLCDHENGERIGERGYVDNLRGRYQMTIQEAWMACAAGGIRAYQAMGGAARQALQVQFAAVPAMSHAANQQRAQQLNPQLP